MAVAPALIPIEEYLNTSYSPDCEYIRGAVIPRNVGQGEHSYTQGKIFRKLDEFCDTRDFAALVEQRTRVAEFKVRVPDVCVVRKLERVTTEPPLLCVEVISPDDRWSRINASVADYLEMGVPCVWVIDPLSSRAWMYEGDKPPVEVRDGRLTARELGVEIDLKSVLPAAPLE